MRQGIQSLVAGLELKASRRRENGCSQLTTAAANRSLKLRVALNLKTTEAKNSKKFVSLKVYRIQEGSKITVFNRNKRMKLSVFNYYSRK